MAKWIARKVEAKSTQPSPQIPLPSKYKFRDVNLSVLSSYHVKDLRESDPDVHLDGLGHVEDGAHLAVVVGHEVGQQPGLVLHGLGQGVIVKLLQGHRGLHKVAAAATLLLILLLLLHLLLWEDGRHARAGGEGGRVQRLHAAADGRVVVERAGSGGRGGRIRLVLRFLRVLRILGAWNK